MSIAAVYLAVSAAPKRRSDFAPCRRIGVIGEYRSNAGDYTHSIPLALSKLLDQFLGGESFKRLRILDGGKNPACEGSSRGRSRHNPTEAFPRRVVAAAPRRFERNGVRCRTDAVSFDPPGWLQRAGGQ